MREAYGFDVATGRVVVTFLQDFPSTYCTISVIEHNRKIFHYHDGVVYNFRDNFNPRMGRFLAYKKALRKRFDDLHSRSNMGFDLQPDESLWKIYYKKFAHMLAEQMDKKDESTL